LPRATTRRPGASTGVLTSRIEAGRMTRAFASLVAAVVLLPAAPGALSQETPPETPEASQWAAEIEQRLSRVERFAGSSALLEISQRLDQLRDETRRLHGVIELQEHTVNNLKKKQQDLYADLDRRIQLLTEKLQQPTAPADAELPADLSPDLSPDSGQYSPLEAGAAAPANGAAGAANGELPTPEAAPAPRQADAEAAGGITAAATPPQDGDGAQTLPQAAPPIAPPAAPPNAPPAAPQPPVAAAAPAVTDPQPPPATPAEVPWEQDPLQEQAAYEKAFNFLKQSHYDHAIEGFQEYLSKYPEGELADNAQYWLAEAFYVSQRYQTAVVEYQKLLSGYPASLKYPDALLKIGYSQYELGDQQQARKTLEQVMRKFPDSTVARLAAKRLNEFRAQKP